MYSGKNHRKQDGSHTAVLDQHLPTHGTERALEIMSTQKVDYN